MLVLYFLQPLCPNHTGPHIAALSCLHGTTTFLARNTLNVDQPVRWEQHWEFPVAEWTRRYVTSVGVRAATSTAVCVQDKYAGHRAWQLARRWWAR